MSHSVCQEAWSSKPPIIAKIILIHGLAMIYPFFLGFMSCKSLRCLVFVVYKRTISPRIAGRLFVKRLAPPGALFQLLDVGRLFHINLVAFPVIEMVFKICQLLVGYDSDSKSVSHLPFAVERYYTFLDISIDVRVHM